MKVFIAGCGYVGTALGAELVKSGHEAWGLRRNVDAARTLEISDIRPVLGDMDKIQKIPSVK